MCNQPRLGTSSHMGNFNSNGRSVTKLPKLRNPKTGKGADLSHPDTMGYLYEHIYVSLF